MPSEGWRINRIAQRLEDLEAEYEKKLSSLEGRVAALEAEVEKSRAWASENVRVIRDSAGVDWLVNKVTGERREVSRRPSGD